MSAIWDRYDRLATAFADKVAAVPEDAWSNPSPCEGWTARDVVRHVVDTQGLFLGFVGQEPGALPSVDEDPLAAVQAATDRTRACLADPAVAEATFEGMGGTTSYQDGVDRFLSADLIVHAWDLAKATGQDTTMLDEDVVAMRALAESFPSEAMRGPGAFGPEVEVPADAGDQDRLLGFLGRRP